MARGCKELLHLDLGGCPAIRDFSLLALCEAGFDPGLRTLSLRDCADVSETGVAWLAERWSTHRRIWYGCVRF